MDGYDGAIGGQVRTPSRTTERQEEEEETPFQEEEASLTESPESVPGQVARHGQVWEERDLGHVPASVGTSVLPARWAQETQNVAGVGDAQCQRLLNKVKHISTWRPKARVMIFRQMQFEKQF